MLLFVDQMAKNSKSPDYYLSFREYAFDRKSGNFTNTTDSYIEYIKRMKNELKNKNQSVISETSVTDLKMSRKMLYLMNERYVFIEGSSISSCPEILFKGKVSCFVSQITLKSILNSGLSVQRNKGSNQLFAHKAKCCADNWSDITPDNIDYFLDYPLEFEHIYHDCKAVLQFVAMDWSSVCHWNPNHSQVSVDFGFSFKFLYIF